MEHYQDPQDCPHCKVKMIIVDEQRFLKCQDCKAVFGPYEAEPVFYEHG
jgi:hypothetical protein